MKTIAVIGASYLQLPLIQKIKEMKHRVICFAWEQGADAAPYADRFYPVSIVEKEEILDICRQEQISGIASIASDAAVPTVCYVAQKLNLIANSVESAMYSTNKFLMRQRLREAGVNTPNFFKVNAETSLTDLELNYPVIVKPCDRSGSLGVTKVNSPGDLTKAVRYAISQAFCKEAIVEEFIRGREVSVETISGNGEHCILTMTDKITSGEPHFVELAHHQPAQLAEEVEMEIQRQTVIGLNALLIRHGASHSEFLITPDNKVFITEIGGRMGGDFIGSDLVRLSTGYDFVRGVVEVALGEYREPIIQNYRCSGVWFYSIHTPQVKDYIRKSPQYPFIIQAELFRSDVVSPLTRSADRSGYFIYAAAQRIEV